MKFHEIRSEGIDKLRGEHLRRKITSFRGSVEMTVGVISSCGLHRTRFQGTFFMLKRVVLVCLLGMGAMALCLSSSIAEEKETDKKGQKDKEEGRKGTVTGTVTAKGDTWIEVKADGEEKARRYVPHWKGGAPSAGGGLDKEMLKTISDTPLKSRILMEWSFEERPRVEKITVLKGKDEANPKK
jgi:hypothetical protein